MGAIVDCSLHFTCLPCNSHSKLIGCLPLQDKRALAAHEKFLAALKKLDADITERNSPKHGSKIRGVVGARGLPYELLRPHSKEGVTSRGVPCSTSI